MRSFACLLLVVAATQAAVLRNGVELPWYSTVCSRSDEKLDNCLKESIQTLLKTISRDGIRQLGIGPLDPWSVEELDMNLGREQTFKIGFKFQDVNTYGLSRMEILEVRSNFADRNNMTLEFDFFNKKIFTEGKYSAEGVISAMPIVAKGEYNMSLSDVKGVFKMWGHVVEKNGDEHLAVDRATMSPDVGDFQFALTNDKYPELTNLLAALMNANWKYIYAGMSDYAEDTFDQVIRPRLNLAFLKVPLNQIVKDSGSHLKNPSS
uniref:Protein takeout n=1 Tax=Lygus hesperus TaxID=30085 RepID=A0A146M8M3_LYGHE